MKIDLSNKETGLKNLYQNTLDTYIEYLKSEKVTDDETKKVIKSNISTGIGTAVLVFFTIGLVNTLITFGLDPDKFLSNISIPIMISIIVGIASGIITFIIINFSEISEHKKEYEKAEEEFHNISKNIDAFFNAALNGGITLQYKMTSRNTWAYRELLKCEKLSENRIIKVMFRSTGLCNTTDLIITYADPNGDVKKETINDVFYSENIDVEDDLLYLNENGILCFVKKVAANQTA